MTSRRCSGSGMSGILPVAGNRATIGGLFLGVIPANAGIQRCALRARYKHYLRVADPRQVTFFCSGQKKVTQEKAAPDAALFFRSAALRPPLSHATPAAGD